MSKKAIEVIKNIRRRESYMNEKASFCKEHNFILEAEKFKFAEDELRKIANMLENEFGTGYISV